MGSWSVRTRLTVIGCLVMALLCVVISALGTALGYGHETRERVDQAEATALKTVRLIRSGELPREIVTSSRSSIVQVVDAQGRVQAGTAPQGLGPRLSTQRPPADETAGTEVECDLPGLHGCKIVVVIRVYRPGGDWYVYSLEDAVPWYVGDLFLAQMILASLAIVALAGAGAYQVIGRALRPVEEIRAQTGQISAAVLAGRSTGHRITLPPQHDELRALAVTSNEMIAHLETSLLREREFTSSTSHDLRTPLAAMRVELDEALLHPDDTDWPPLARRLLTSVDRLQQLVEDLLVLARLDAGAAQDQQVLDLADLVQGEITRLRGTDALPDELDLEVRTGPAPVHGSRIQLTRLFDNLLDNALRHADHRVGIDVRTEADQVVLQVANDGDAIPEDKREAVFERFTRLDASRTKDTGGSGLGLTIVRDIAHAHHGTAHITPSPEGTRVTIRLPRA
ncbi:signal transduction histidine kinase [Actinocorallia herbida]|uniref:histidine kinase n=1 Tax=Actinocorallia herbida TaxID=58109 RepID=A0A3N1CUL0_9ACTN|nr:HAMP domain-containing sensor histidine kinase [Actinocorallia herbida]ROO84993.1 signal transduction histidine kinase [Actinocorallia herbida]